MQGLVVSWFYPPATSAEAMVTFKLLKGSAFRYDVLGAQSDKWSYGANSPLHSSNIRAQALPAPSFRAWEAACAARAEELLRTRRYDFLMTRAMPPQCHTVGLRLKRRHPGLFWIASMADPIGRNPYDRDRYFRRGAGALLKNPVRTAARCGLYLGNEVFDRRVSRRADLLIYPSADQARYTLGRRFERFRDKVLTLPHSYDGSLLDAAGAPAPRADGRVLLSYLGYLSDQRSAAGLIKAAALLQSRAPEAAERLRIRIVGRLPDGQSALIRSLHVENLFEVFPPVPYLDSLRSMREADWLMLIDADFPFMPHNIFMVSKLADYMGAGKPILGLTTPEGPSGSLLRRAGCPVVRPGDAEAISRALEQIARGALPAPDFSVYRELDNRTVAARFDRKVASLLQKSGAPAAER